MQKKSQAGEGPGLFRWGVAGFAPGKRTSRYGVSIVSFTSVETSFDGPPRLKGP